MVQIADEFGWPVVDHYLRHPLVDNEVDEKRLLRAKKVAEEDVRVKRTKDKGVLGSRGHGSYGWSMRGNFGREGYLGNYRSYGGSYNRNGGRSLYGYGEFYNGSFGSVRRRYGYEGYGKGEQKSPYRKEQSRGGLCYRCNNPGHFARECKGEEK